MLVVVGLPDTVPQRMDIAVRGNVAWNFAWGRGSNVVAGAEAGPISLDDDDLDIVIQLHFFCGHLDLQKAMIAKRIAFVGRVQDDAADRTVALQSDKIIYRTLDFLSPV